MVTSNYNYPKIELKNKQFEEIVDRMLKIAPETKESVIREALLPFANTQYVQYGYEIEYDDDLYLPDYIHKDLLEWSRGNCRKFADIFEYNDKPIIDKYTFKVYAYEHGGTVFSLSPFSCPFDSCFVGTVRYTESDMTPEEARKFIAGVIDEINSIYEGEIYRFTVYRKITTIVNKTEILISKDVVDSCGCFIGNLNYCESEAKLLTEYHYKYGSNEITESNI
jgi:hypothetical protein